VATDFVHLRDIFVMFELRPTTELAKKFPEN
jgi:hypothetical protein